MSEQQKVEYNLVIRMLLSIVSKAADRSSSDKIDTQSHSGFCAATFLVGRL